MSAPILANGFVGSALLASYSLVFTVGLQLQHGRAPSILHVCWEAAWTVQYSRNKLKVSAAQMLLNVMLLA